MQLNTRTIVKCKKMLLWALPIVVVEIIFPHASMAAFGIESETEVRPLASIEMVIAPDPEAEAAAVALQVSDTASAQEQDAVQRLPESDDRTVKKTVRVTVTAYASVPELTDDDPFTMADGKQVFDGAVATNVLPFGTKVRFPDLFGGKVFEVHDRMNARYNGVYIVDIWHTSKQAAVQFGAKYNITMEILE